MSSSNPWPQILKNSCFGEQCYSMEMERQEKDEAWAKREKKRKEAFCQELGFNLKLHKMVEELDKAINDCLLIIRVLVHIKERRKYFNKPMCTSQNEMCSKLASYP